MEPRRREQRRAPVRAAWLAAAAAVIGCQVTLVDLGSNHPPDAGAPDPIPLYPLPTSDCPAVTEAQLDALRGHPCDGGPCGSGPGPARATGSAAELFAVTAGRWRTCAGEVPWSADVVGIELQAGCTLFLLHEAPDGGGLVRGISPDDQGTFNVVTTEPGGDRTLELFFPGWTQRVHAVTSDCPHTMRWEVPDAGAIDFAAVPSSSPPIQ